MVSLEFFSDIILPVALPPWGRLSLEQKWVPGVFPGGKGGRCVRLTTLPPSCAIVMESGNLNFLEPSGPLQACNGTALPFFLIWIRKFSWFSTTNFINENIHWHGTGRISNCFHRLLHKVLGHALPTILDDFLLLNEYLPHYMKNYPPKYPVFYKRMKMFKVSWYRSCTEHWPNCTTCST